MGQYFLDIYVSYVWVNDENKVGTNNPSATVYTESNILLLNFLRAKYLSTYEP